MMEPLEKLRKKKGNVYIRTNMEKPNHAGITYMVENLQYFFNVNITP